MERLTSIDGAGRNIIELKKFCDNDDWIISESKDKITIKTSSKAINKLAEFEDFMESLGLEDLEELEHIIGYPRFVDGYDENNKPINKVEFVTYIESFRELLEEKKNFKDAIEELLETNNHIKGVSDKYYQSYKEKFNRVLELAKENQALKDRWEKLKEYIDTFKEYNIEEANLAWKIINKIQELENGE